MPAPPALGAPRNQTVHALLKAGPQHFRELMEGTGSRDGRETVRALEAVRNEIGLDRLADGRYALAGTVAESRRAGRQLTARIQGGSMEYRDITFEVRDNGVAIMTLNRPAALNSFTRRMFEEWTDVIRRCAYEDAIRVLIITGSGRAFSSGVDLSALGNEKPSPQFPLLLPRGPSELRQSGGARGPGNRCDQRALLRRRGGARAVLRHSPGRR